MFSNEDLPLLAILRGVTEKNLQPLVEVFLNTNICFLEITMNTIGAAGLIKQIIPLTQGKIKVGAGTVLNLNDLGNALAVGAEFIVTPSVQDDVIRKCVSDNVPVIPGALTPTEIHKAWDLGASMVKVFPASVLGPGYMKAIKGPFNHIKLMAVGGIGEDNISEFFKNGADAIGFGGSILKEKWLAEKKYEIIEEKIHSLISGFHACSSHSP